MIFLCSEHRIGRGATDRQRISNMLLLGQIKGVVAKLRTPYYVTFVINVATVAAV
jgi:hypothetical protein